MRYVFKLLPVLLVTVIVLRGRFGTPALAADAGAVNFSGKYQGMGLSVEIVTARDGAYTGTIIMGDKRLPLTARVVDGKLQGSFISEQTNFPFYASLSGRDLSLVSGDVTHALRKESPPVNPLAIPDPSARPANPLANPTANTGAKSEAPKPDASPKADGALAGYSVLASTDAGKSLFAQNTDAKSAQAALQATLHDLGKFFDAKPTVGGAFVDDKDQRGGASFTAQLKGKDIKGSILCGIGDKGAAITVIYYNADAKPQEIAALVASMPAQIKWEEHQLPGGSGVVKTPSDWKITGASNIGAVTTAGPGGQSVSLGDGAEVLAPNNWLAPNQMRTPVAQRMLVAPFAPPAQALKNLMPQISMLSQAKGGPALELEKIIKASPLNASLPNGQAQEIYYAFAMGKPGAMVHYRGLAQLECYPISNDTWAYYFIGGSAPDTTFDRDLPVMIDIAKSWKLNDNAVANNTQQNIAAQNQRFAAFEQSMKENQAAFDGYMQSVRNSETVREKSNADFDEVIRGYRTVEDTKTGERTDVDLGNVHDIVQKMNEYDGADRYKEIPLRDQ
jgi:hypothetical protein